MFETALGIPAHPLLVHLPVIFVPLLIILSLAYALLPRWRPRTDWAVVLLAITTPIAALLARESGLALRARLIREQAVSAQDLAGIAKHESYGTTTFVLSCVLGVLALAMVGVQTARRRRSRRVLPAWLSLGLIVLVILACVADGYYVFKTGDTGSHLVWQGR